MVIFLQLMILSEDVRCLCRCQGVSAPAFVAHTQCWQVTAVPLLCAVNRLAASSYIRDIRVLLPPHALTTSVHVSQPGTSGCVVSALQ